MTSVCFAHSNVGWTHVSTLLNQRLCHRVRSTLANRLDSATPFCSLLPPQAALANVPDREAADSADERVCTKSEVPARGGDMSPPYTFLYQIATSG